MASPKRRRLRKKMQLERLRKANSEPAEPISSPDLMPIPPEEEESVLEVSEELSEPFEEEEALNFDSMTKREIIDWLTEHEVEADMSELKRELVEKAEAVQNG